MHPIYESQLQTDSFDRIPDALVLLIFNQLSDIKTLTRCLAVSKRFNLLVPQAENLLVKVDCVISNETGEWFLLHLLKSILQSLQDLISPKRSSIQQLRNRQSPTEILRGFERIRRLEIELPSGDLQLEKGTVLRWKAEFGRSLKSCVVFAVRKIEKVNYEINNGADADGDEIDFNGDGRGGLKLRVMWTISSLIAASTRHYLLREVIREHTEIESLVLRDREEQGIVMMNKEEMGEFRESEEEEVGWNNRTRVPAVRMRMRHEPRLDLGGGVRMRGATLVVVRPRDVTVSETKMTEEQIEEDTSIALGAFGGVFGEAVEALLRKPSYLLEMNSF